MVRHQFFLSLFFVESSFFLNKYKDPQIGSFKQRMKKKSVCRFIKNSTVYVQRIEEKPYLLCWFENVVTHVKSRRKKKSRNLSSRCLFDFGYATSCACVFVYAEKVYCLRACCHFTDMRYRLKTNGIRTNVDTIARRQKRAKRKQRENFLPIADIGLR